MSYLAIAILIIIALGLLLAVLYRLLNFLVSRGLRPKMVVISKDVLVTDKWFEIECEKPATPPNHRQHIYLKVPGYEHDWQNKPFDIQLLDGTVVHPKIEVIDQRGDIYETKDGTRWGNLIGFSVRNGDARLENKRQSKSSNSQCRDL
ncbi:MAG TPA: hypothetical protein VL327_02365 [Pyrinomonadaceae bacterium]|jgi:hypothetical protein|nr:hypothetical protein [Pyrinomonadaceae bacterium]